MTANPSLDAHVQQVWATCGASLFRTAVTIVGERSVAEDLVQEAFVRVWRRRARLRDPQALVGYLRTAVRNLALDHLRRCETANRAFQGKALLTPIADEGGGGSDDAEVIARALAELPAEQREVVVQRIYEGRTFREVAEATQSPIGTVQSRFRYAMKRLRTLLEVEIHD